jgi:hypothetical protein
MAAHVLQSLDDLGDKRLRSSINRPMVASPPCQRPHRLAMLMLKKLLIHLFFKIGA